MRQGAGAGQSVRGKRVSVRTFGGWAALTPWEDVG